MKIKQLLCIIIILSHTAAQAGIATSFPIMTLITREIVQQDIEVFTLTNSGELAHHFEPSPKTLMQLRKQDLLIINGLGLEEWVPLLSRQSWLKEKIIEAANRVNPRSIDHENKHIDPHAWLSPVYILTYIDNIKEALVRQYPEKKALFEKRTIAVKGAIQKWHDKKKTQFTQQLSSCLVVTTHNAFGYLTENFNLKSMALLSDHEGETLSPRQLSLKIKEMKKTPLRVFFGDGSEHDVSLKNLAKKTDSEWGGILWGDSLPGNAATSSLLDYFEHNTSLILKACIHDQ